MGLADAISTETANVNTVKSAEGVHQEPALKVSGITKMPESASLTSLPRHRRTFASAVSPRRVASPAPQSYRPP